MKSKEVLVRYFWQGGSSSAVYGLNLLLLLCTFIVVENLSLFGVDFLDLSLPSEEVVLSFPSPDTILFFVVAAVRVRAVFLVRDDWRLLLLILAKCGRLTLNYECNGIKMTRTGWINYLWKKLWNYLWAMSLFVTGQDSGPIPLLPSYFHKSTYKNYTLQVLKISLATTIMLTRFDLSPA